MPGKDDPLEASSGRRITLWLDREGMEESRNAYFLAWLDMMKHGGHGVQFRSWSGDEDTGHMTVSTITKDVGEVRIEWEIAYAAAVAAFDFLMSGRLRPG